MTVDFELAYGVLFLGTAGALLLLESIGAVRQRPIERSRRWATNIGLLVIGLVVSALVLPRGVHAFAAALPPGPLARLQWPFAVEALVTFLVLDLWRYGEHRVFHRVRLLWRLHLVHHSDVHVDLTTAERHHPGELLLGTAMLVALVTVLGLPAAALGVYLLAATFVTLYTHANVRVPRALDAALEWLVMTPRLHAVHHSTAQRQTDSNFGAVLTIWDRLFGSYVDPSRDPVVAYGLEYFHLARDTGLGGVLMQPLRFGDMTTYPVRTAGDAHAGTRPPATLPVRWKEALVGAAVGAVLVLLVTWPTFVDMMLAWRGESYQYAWLVLPLVAYLLWAGRARWRAGPQPEPTLAGVAIAAVAMTGWLAASLVHLDVGREVALVVALQGVALAACGWRVYRQLFPTLALTFLMIPSGDVLLMVLRTVTLRSIELFATIARLPHHVDGFAIFVGTHRYIVVDDCAGLPFFTLATFLGYALGVMLFRSFGRSVALALAAGGLAIVTNVLRVNAIVLVDWLRDSQMDLAAHGAFQWIALLATLGGLFHLVVRADATRLPEPPPVEAAGPAISSRRFAPIVAGLVAASIAATAVALPGGAGRAPRASGVAFAPPELGRWGLVEPIAAWVVDRDGTSESTELRYVWQDRTMRVLVVEALSAAAKLHEPALSWAEPGVTWHEKQSAVERACGAARCVDVRHVVLQRNRSAELRHVYTTYVLGDYVTASRLAVRAANGWRRVAANATQVQLVGITAADALAGDDVATAVFGIAAALARPVPSVATR